VGGVEETPVVEVEQLQWRHCLTAETIQGPALALQSIDHIECCDGLAASVLGVSDGIADDVLQKHLQHTTRLLIDETGDTLDSSTTSETADSRLGDTYRNETDVGIRCNVLRLDSIVAYVKGA
jgi:hypothetical protein